MLLWNFVLLHIRAPPSLYGGVLRFPSLLPRDLLLEVMLEVMLEVEESHAEESHGFRPSPMRVVSDLLPKTGSNKFRLVGIMGDAAVAAAAIQHMVVPVIVLRLHAMEETEEEIKGLL